MLDLLHPCQTDTAKRKEQQKTNTIVTLHHVNLLRVIQCGLGNFIQGPHWRHITVTECLGNVMYKVQLEEQNDVIWRRHANQLRTRIVLVNLDSDNSVTSDDSARPVVNTPCPLHRSSRVRKPTNR